MSSVSLSVSVPGKSAETEAPVAPYLEQPLRRLQALVTNDREAQIRHGQELHQYITDELQYSPHVDEICERIGLMATLWFTQPGSTHQLSAGFIVMHCVSRANLPLLRKTKYKIITEFFNSTKTYLASPKLDITLINPGSRIMGHVVSLNDENSNYTVAGLVRDAREQLLRGTADQKKTICKCAILRELAMSTPTVFQQHAPVAVKDILEVCRTCTNARCGEALGEALYAALCVVSQREQRKEAKESIFNDCYKTAADCLRAANEAAETKAETKLDEAMLGGLIILNELLRCADSRFEEQRQDVEDQQEPASNTVSSASSEWSSRYGMRLLANVLRHSRGSSGSSNRSSRTFTKSQMTTLSGKEGAQSQQPILALFAPLKRVVHESHTCKRTINDNIAELLELIFGQPRNREQEHRNNCCVELARAPHTQLLLLEIIPRMASLAASHIEPATLERCVYFIERHMQKTSKERDYRAVAFTSLGLLTFAVVSEESGTDSKREEQEAQRSQHEENVHNTKLKSTLLKRLHGGTYVTIRSMLVSPEHTPRRTSSAAIETRVLTCLSLLARSLRQDVRAFMKELLPTLLRGGLTEVVTRTLFDIHESISSLSALIKDGLLDQLWVKVMNRPRPPKYLPPPQEEYTSDYLPPPREDEQTLLALYILASFEFPIDSTETFLRHLSSVFLQSSNPLIRLRTVRTCCHLMRPLMRLMHESYATDRVLWLKYVKFIAEVVDQLINVGISDHSVDVRLTVFGHCFSTEHTTPRLDNFLEQCEALNKMFLGLSDGSLAVKKAVLGVLCRLSNQNPALVLPELRLFLMDTLFVLKLGGTDKAKQQSARLLSMLVNCPQFFVSTYLELILLQLIPMLTKPSIEATGSTGASSFADRQCSVELSVVILNTVGEIAQLDEYGIIKEQYLDHLMEVLVEYMQDYSSEERRRASVRALTQIAQSTGYVVEPYRKYPQIMDILLKFLKSQSESKFRGEVLQALGVLGAIDPYTYNGWAQSIDHSYETSAFALSLCEPKGIHERDARQQIIQWFARERLTLEDFYPAIVIASAMHVLQDPSLSNYHLVMMNLIETFFRGLADKGHLYLDQVVPQMLVIIRAPENFNTTISQNLISRMANLIEIMPDKMGSYIGDILELIREIWDPRSNLTKVIIPLIEQIARTQSAIFAKHIPSLMGGMLQVFSGDRHRNQEVVSQVFCALKACRPSLQDYVHLIVPPIFQIMEDPIMDNDIRILAINTVISFADYLKLENSASAILHPLWRVLSAPAFCPEAHSTALKCVCAMILQLQGRFSAYQQTFDKVLRTFRPGVNHLDTSEYNRLISMYVQKQAGPLHADGDKAIISRTLNEPTTLGNLLSITTKDSNTEALSMEVKKVYSCFTKEEWVEWMRSLFTSLVRYSVSRAILSCIEASLVYQPLIHDLFNAAFMSCWTSLSEEQKDDWTKAMEYAISFSGVPEITILILRLAEFMEHSEKGPLPIAPKTLGEQAYKSRAFAKALHYKEQQFLAAEMEGNQVVLAETIEQLISINNKLQLKEAGKGLLKYAEARGINLSPRALEKLHDWEGALRRCNEIIGGASMEVEQTPETMERVHLAKMRSLSALARWSELDEVVTDCSKRTVFKDKGKLYELGADAAWGQKNWSKLEKYAKQLNPNTFQGAYYKAVTSIHGGKGNSQTSLEIISRARDLLDSNLTSVASESYERAYSTMVSVQAVAELEECVRYQVLKNERPKIRQIWQKRLHTGVRRDVDDWHRLVRIRSLVLSPDSKNQDEVESTNELPCRSTPVFVRQNPAVIEAAKLELKFEEEDLSYTKLKFASLCRKNGMLDLSRHIMVEMFGYDPKEKDFRLSREKPDLSLAYAKYMWQSNDPSMSQTSLRQVAFDRLLSLTESEEAKKYFERLEGSNWEGDRRLANKLKSKMYLQLGLMKESLTTSPDEASISKTVQFYHQAATMCDYGRSWYKAWHALARSSYEALRFYQREREATQAARQATFGQPQVPHMPLPIGLPPGVPGLPAHMPPSIPPNQEHLRNHAHALVQRYRQDDQAVQDYAISCVRCFVKAIQIAPKSCLQDTLRLLRVLFDFGHITDVHDELHQNLPSLGVTPWLQVIPQLTARIETSRHNVRRLVSSILQGIAREHPHALIYPITVITKSNNQARVAAAERILKPMREQHKSLVDQAKLLSDELIRVAILWPELWHEALEEASRQYFAERNIQGMLNTLRPLHRMIEAGHQTNNENSFNMNYSKQLKEAEEACRRYELTRNARELTHAWEYYYDVFRQITKSLPALNELRTPEVSPLLNAQRNMDIIVPGTYDPGKAPILIQKINQVISVIMSKQRPRKVSILGTDGQEYQFLLKGHEDPRQDERVMQLFGLVNALLLEDPTTSRRNLTIQRYSVTALSQNSGLIGWVPHCDTLHQLLREYRERKKVLLNKEHKLMQNMAPDYDHLTLPQKVEVFESALDETQDLGMDLAKIFWFKSPDSETWFLRRTNYTCSLAVMSMVGYVLGLGDRHPSNLMLDRMSGKIVHIDFGDCFEVAMTREKFPEKIPFRLTRMLVKAMEVTGIEGNYRLTCERVMRVLREHSDSLMAVLEAFIYDPLVNWRLDSAATADPSAPQSHGPPPMGMPPPNMVPPERDAFGQLEHDALAGPADIPNSAIETTSRRAYEVLERVRAKLQGRDFNLAQPLDVEKQVDRLIEAATRHENLCQCYIGWCPFW